AILRGTTNISSPKTGLPNRHHGRSPNWYLPGYILPSLHKYTGTDAMTVLTLALFLQDATPDQLPTAQVATHSSALTEMLHNSGPMALTVLGILLAASIFSWAIMLSKWRNFKAAEKQSRRFVK